MCTVPRTTHTYHTGPGRRRAGDRRPPGTLLRPRYPELCPHGTQRHKAAPRRCTGTGTEEIRHTTCGAQGRQDHHDSNTDTPGAAPRREGQTGAGEDTGTAPTHARANEGLEHWHIRGVAPMVGSQGRRAVGVGQARGLHGGAVRGASGSDKGGSGTMRASSATVQATREGDTTGWSRGYCGSLPQHAAHGVPHPRTTPVLCLWGWVQRPDLGTQHRSVGGHGTGGRRPAFQGEHRRVCVHDGVG
jgi:hypothetical protein